MVSRRHTGKASGVLAMSQRTLAPLFPGCVLVWTLLRGASLQHSGEECKNNHKMCKEDLDRKHTQAQLAISGGKTSAFVVMTGTATQLTGMCAAAPIWCTMAVSNPMGVAVLALSGVLYWQGQEFITSNGIVLDANTTPYAKCDEVLLACKAANFNNILWMWLILVWTMLTWLYLLLQQRLWFWARVSSVMLTISVVLASVLVKDALWVNLLTMPLLLLQVLGEVEFPAACEDKKDVEDSAVKLGLEDLMKWADAQEGVLEWNFWLRLSPRALPLVLCGGLLRAMTQQSLKVSGPLLAVYMLMPSVAKFIPSLSSHSGSLVQRLVSIGMGASALGPFPVVGGIMVSCIPIAVSCGVLETVAGFLQKGLEEMESLLRSGLMFLALMYCLPLMVMSVADTLKCLQNYGNLVVSSQALVHDFVRTASTALEDIPESEQKDYLKSIGEKQQTVRQKLAPEHILKAWDAEDAQSQGELQGVVARLRQDLLSAVKVARDTARPHQDSSGNRKQIDEECPDAKRRQTAEAVAQAPAAEAVAETLAAAAGHVHDTC